MSSPEVLLRDLGENEIVRRLTERLHVAPEQVLRGAGDDCAVLPQIPGHQLLFKTDALVEKVHFTWDMGAARIGRKAVCRVLSDLAAMGGAPQALLVTVGAPGDLPISLLEGAYEGINAAGRQYQCSIAGGELSSTSGPSWFSIAALGTVPAAQSALRSGGRAGDLLYVTGRLGGSFKSGRHLDFTPRLAEGQWLVAHFPIRAMMDLSDGLATDLPRLAEASRCGFALDDSRIPRHPNTSLQEALGDGEDYELLLAISPEQGAPLESAWAETFPDLPLTRIGQLTEWGAGPQCGTKDGSGGYQHYR